MQSKTSSRPTQANRSQLQVQGAWTFQSLPPWPRCSCHYTRGPWRISSARTFRCGMHIWQHQFEQRLESSSAWLRWMEMAMLRWKNSNRRRGFGIWNELALQNSLGATSVAFATAHHVTVTRFCPTSGSTSSPLQTRKRRTRPFGFYQCFYQGCEDRNLIPEFAS